MENKQKNLNKSKEKKKLTISIKNNNTLFPHNSKLNNLKTKKYFSNSTVNSNLMKIALNKYRENNLLSTQNNNISNFTNSSVSTCNVTKTNNRIFKFDKSLLNQAEPKTKTSFQKIEPKLLKISSKECVNINDDLDEFKICNEKNMINQNHQK